MISLLPMLAEAAAPAAPGATPDGGGGMLTMLLMLGGFFVVMYFFAIRPQKKQAEQRKAMLEAVKVGDNVVTAGGFFGKIVKVLDDRFVIELSDGNVRVEIAKFSIAEVLNPQTTEEK